MKSLFITVIAILSLAMYSCQEEPVNTDTPTEETRGGIGGDPKIIQD